MSDEINDLGEKAGEAFEKAKKKAKELGEEAKEKAREFRDETRETTVEFKEEAKKTAEEFSEGFKTAGGDNKKILAGILGIFLGWAGIHKFILGYQKEGIILLVLMFSNLHVQVVKGFR